MVSQLIEDAIASYPQHVAEHADGDAAPYSAEGLTQIYAPRVQQLLELKAAGHTHAFWAFDPALGINRWHGA